MQGRRLTWAQSLKDTYTDGIVVLHRGRRIYERYFGALQAQRPHACFSITKSYAATLAATLLHERALDETKTVSHYLPEMIGTAYEDASLRHVLDMQIGVEFPSCMRIRRRISGTMHARAACDCALPATGSG